MGANSNHVAICSGLAAICNQRKYMRNVPEVHVISEVL